MNKYYLIKTDGKVNIGEIIDKTTIQKEFKIECVDITKEINEKGATENGFLTEIIDTMKEE